MLSETKQRHDNGLPYLRFTPTAQPPGRGPLPLIVFLHGDGEKGETEKGDSVETLYRLKTHGLPYLASKETEQPRLLLRSASVCRLATGSRVFSSSGLKPLQKRCRTCKRPRWHPN
jgi:hypothetical protein